MTKAVALISGGLDSLVATKLILEQGIAVEGINFFTGFSGDHDYCYRNATPPEMAARKVAEQLGIKLHLVEVIQPFKPVLLHPNYGYGANLNPCLDCKLFMITQAYTWMKQHQFDFLISGEVLGQRAKSQRKDTLPIATKLTNDLIVRPLSAKLLPASLPEKLGWIQRSQLGDISGRSRTPQLQLAKKFGFAHLPQPGGGCLLTDKHFCNRLQDLLQHNPDYQTEDIMLLRVGRHLRIKAELKIIVGREESENHFILKQAGPRLWFQTVDYPGALLLLDGVPNEENIMFTASLAAYFSKAKTKPTVRVASQSSLLPTKLVTLPPLTEDQLASSWYL